MTTLLQFQSWNVLCTCTEPDVYDILFYLISEVYILKCTFRAVRVGMAITEIYTVYLILHNIATELCIRTYAVKCSEYAQAMMYQ